MIIRLMSAPRLVLHLFLASALVPTILNAPVRAGDEPEKAARVAQEDVVPKVAAICGSALGIAYDGASLRKLNKDVGYDQTDGALECNEPLRLLWYACGVPAGKAAVKVAGIKQILCKGVPDTTGSLALAAGTLTVGRAYDERKPYLRVRKQLEAILKTAIPVAISDPYGDQAWNDLRNQANPVTSTVTYCLRDGEKVAFDDHLYDPLVRRKASGQVRCWRDGAMVIDLKIDEGRLNGLLTEKTLKGRRSLRYRDHKRQGEARTYEGERLVTHALYEAGEEVWSKELHPSGGLARYSRASAAGLLGLAKDESGRVWSLTCGPAARHDPILHVPCGFDGAATTSIYDGTGKVSEVVTYERGLLSKQGAGNSDYAQRSEVALVAGKKHGAETIRRKDGTLESSIPWVNGVKDGTEVTYAADGKRVVHEIIWSAGAPRRSTEWYLNGNRKTEEIHRSAEEKRVVHFWDTGKVAAEGDYVLCGRRDFGFDYRAYCENGLHRWFYEDGKPEAEGSFQRGKRHGPAKTWWASGKPASDEQWAEDRPVRAKSWDRDGKLIADDEFEADGSRKVRR